MMNFIPNTVLICVLTSLVIGCSSVVPGSVLKMRQTSPLEADPAQIAARITLPEGLGIVPGTAQLKLAGTRQDTGETLSGVFAFTVEQGKTTTFRFSPAEADRLTAHQARLKEWKDALGDGMRGSLAVDLDPCVIGAGPSPDALVSIDLQLDAETGFLPLIRNGPVSAVAAATEMQDLTPCPPAP